MKYLIAVLAIVFMMGSPVLSNGYNHEDMRAEAAAKDKKESEKPKGAVTKGSDRLLAPQCPHTLVIQKENSIHVCTTCHVGTHWRIKEEKPDITADYPYREIKIQGNVCRFSLHFGIDSAALIRLTEMFDYLKWHPEVDTVYIDILSGGGEMFYGWQMISVIEAKRSKYKIITAVQGFAASAAFLLFCAGEERLVYEHSMLMWHETWTFSMFSFDTVSSSEEKARVMRLFQDNCHKYLIKRGAFTKEQLDKLIAGEKSLWITGSDALKAKFATGLIQQWK